MSIGIIYPIYKVFNGLIFDNFVLRLDKNKLITTRKTFEFRTRLPKELETGTKIYIYEPAKKGGCRKVVGEFQVGKILNCDYHIGSYPFMPYFCRNVLKNEEYAEKFETALHAEMPDFKAGTAINFALDENSMKIIEKTGRYPDFIEQNQNKVKKTREIIEQCDQWLSKLGFYNEYSESNYKYALETVNPIRYETPKELSEFTKLDGTPVLKAPQGFVYVKTI